MPKNTTELFGLLSFLAILALFLHSVWKFSRRFPNAEDRAPTGVDGGLLLLMTGCVTLTVWFAATIAARAPLYAHLSGGELIWTALPEALSALGFLWASLRIVTGRKPSVKTEVALALLAAGPVGAGLLPALRGEAEWAFTLSISVFALWGAFYVLKSVRARHVFG